MSAISLEDAPSPEEDDAPGIRLMTSRRVAIILFNLGGPDEPKAVRRFLFNLFNDRHIIGAPQPFRYLTAQLISRSREKAAQANYAYIGGKSPLAEETRKQADALEEAISKRVSNVTFKCFPAMRYWKPWVIEAAEAAIDWHATDAILLPLYPQYSYTTTASSLEAWTSICDIPVSTICCYPSGQKFAEAHAEAILRKWRDAGEPQRPRVLFSAHGLPQRVIDAGDPYQWQIEQTVAAVCKLLPPEWEHRICYQSRVGPMKWLAPSTEQELQAAAEDKTGVIVSPIAFVSDHIETLVELDIEYAHLAKQLGLPFYLRAPALGAAPRFIDALADLVERALAAPGKLKSEAGVRLCPAKHTYCPHKG